VRVGDRVIEIDSLGQRDHSWGTRDWGAAVHWKWWNVLAAPDMALHVMEIQAFGQTTVHGYVHKDGSTASVIALESDYELDDRFMHTSINAVFHDDEGRATTVRTTRGADLEWPNQYPPYPPRGGHARRDRRPPGRCPDGNDLAA
jgi:hypothetical protein